MVVYYSYKDALAKGLIHVGTKVISYPDRRGQTLRGTIGMTENRDMYVDYTPHKEYFFTVNTASGRCFKDFETNLDIMLVEINE